MFAHLKVVLVYKMCQMCQRCSFKKFLEITESEVEEDDLEVFFQVRHKQTRHDSSTSSTKTFCCLAFFFFFFCEVMYLFCQTQQHEGSGVLLQAEMKGLAGVQ